MNIEIYTKNDTRVKTLENVKGPIPRTGETLSLKQYPDLIEDVDTFIVKEVEYALENNELSPIIRCMPYFGAHNRSHVIEDFGWDGKAG
jgi:hypothetical protein